MRDQILLERAKRMRHEPTPLEQSLWLALRAKRFGGAKFRRQVVIGRYIVDFACRLPRMLVIELDGDTHGSQAGYDTERTEVLEARGYEVIRFTNAEVATNLEGVLTAILAALPLSPTSRPVGPSGGRSAADCSPEGERGKEMPWR